jgi:hypothetical protein
MFAQPQLRFRALSHAARTKEEAREGIAVAEPRC